MEKKPDKGQVKEAGKDHGDDLELKILANISDYLAQRMKKKSGQTMMDENTEGEDLPMSPFLMTPEPEPPKKDEKNKNANHNSKVDKG